MGGSRGARFKCEWCQTHRKIASENANQLWTESCFTSYPIIRSNYKMSPNHRSGNSWIHMYILYIYIHTYTNIFVSLGCVPLRATVERVSLPKNVRILGAHWHPERGPHPIRQQKIESCRYWPFPRWFSGKWMPPPVLLRKTLTMFHGKLITASSLNFKKQDAIRDQPKS